MIHHVLGHVMVPGQLTAMPVPVATRRMMMVPAKVSGCRLGVGVRSVCKGGRNGCVYRWE